ncbi:unnamed protein product [Calicophoron daubneyi]|uniref:Acyl carrier protein n=1 Tax=Calicophoron daubneyi TaxID=300641 RepID=A0AAV2TIL6_CALDB
MAFPARSISRLISPSVLRAAHLLARPLTTATARFPITSRPLLQLLPFQSCSPIALQLQPKRFIKPGLTRDSVKDTVLAVCSEFDKIPADKLTLDSKFITDLGLDSLDHIEIIMQLEDEFWLEIPDVEAEKMHTPRDIIEHVCSMAAKAEPFE